MIMIIIKIITMKEIDADGEDNIMMRRIIMITMI
jgi:hypothetical protein